MSRAGDYALARLPWAVRDDAWVQALFHAAGDQLDLVLARIEAIGNDSFFDRLSIESVLRYEALLGITPQTGQSLEQRRGLIAAAWKSAMKFSLPLIQAMADDFGVGSVVVAYEPGVVHIISADPSGQSFDLSGLKLAIQKVIPAHLDVDYGRQGDPVWTAGEIMAGES